MKEEDLTANKDEISDQANGFDEEEQGHEEGLEDDDAPFGNYIISLENRGVLKISGAESADFLQRILTNDLQLIAEGQEIAQYSLLLTPQGKILYDFFVIAYDKDVFLLDCDLSSLQDIIALLEKYRLQSEAFIQDVSGEYHAIALIGDNVEESIDPESFANSTRYSQTILYMDPREHAMQVRGVYRHTANQQNETPEIFDDIFTEEDYSVYEYGRLWYGLPDIARDLVAGKSFPFDYGLHHLNAIAFDKGCYIGQEVITRFHNRSEPKHALFAVALYEDENNEDGYIPQDSETILRGDKPIGRFCSGLDDIGIALLNISQLQQMIRNEEPLLTASGIALELREMDEEEEEEN